jgi:hypothetical protein
MSSVPSVTAVTSATRAGADTIVAPPATVSAPHAVNSKSKVAENTPTAEKSSAASSAASSTSSASSRLPLGLLLSVSPPPSSNASASSDYVKMQDALRTNNLAAAQQAYQSLQSDLTLDPAALAATTTAETGKLATGDAIATGLPAKTQDPANSSGLNTLA